MPTKHPSATVCLWAGRTVAGLLLVLACWMPEAVSWYGRLRLLTPAGQSAILAGYYLCLIPTGLALADLDRFCAAFAGGRYFCRPTSGASAA